MEAARRKRADFLELSRMPAAQAPLPMREPAGSVVDLGVRPGLQRVVGRRPQSWEKEESARVVADGSVHDDLAVVSHVA